MGDYRTFGPLGVIVLVFGLLAGLLSGDWSSVYVLAHLILGAMMLALYLFTHVDSLKESVGGRQAKYGTNAIVYTLLTLGVIVAVNYFAAQRSWRWDLTEQGIFSLAPQTTQLLDELEVDVVARGFYRDGEEGATRDLLDGIAALTPRFSYEFIDPDKSPELAERYEISQYGTLHIAAGDETAKITEIDEAGITNTLIRLTSARRKVAYYVSGHDELDPEDSTAPRGFGLAKAALDNEGYDFEPLVLATVPDVPADADVLIVAGAERPFLEREVETFGRYLGRGGKAIVMVDPQRGDELRPLLAEHGVALGDDVIIEEFVQLFAGATLGVEPVVGSYGTHEITSGFRERTIYQLVRSVAAMAELPEGVVVDELALTSESSWAETDLERLFDSGEVERDDDRGGPLAVGVAATAAADTLDWTPSLVDSVRGGEVTPSSSSTESTGDAPADLEGRLVVFGDSEWISNRYINNFFNQDLFLNAISWLGGEEQLISIRPRQTRASSVMLTANESQVVFYIAVLLLPELILFCGMLVWLNRRR
ncbi:MAG TPA: Gldg family protein [Acidobacteriota bacterium]|nr:Gldg family protein [Acidobacteriota bacterium]